MLDDASGHPPFGRNGPSWQAPGPLGPFAAGLERPRGAGTLADALRTALGDPSLHLLRPSGSGTWLADEGAETSLATAEGGHAVTLVGPNDRPLAAIVHDAALLEQLELLRAVARVLRLALENERRRRSCGSSFRPSPNRVRGSSLLPRTSGGGLTRLTEREREALALIAEGRSNRAIAERLGITTKTHEGMSGTIFAKLGLEDDPDVNRRVLAVLLYLDGAG